MKKTVLSLLLSAALLTGLLAGCSGSPASGTSTAPIQSTPAATEPTAPAATTTDATTAATTPAATPAATEPLSQDFILEYPEDMKAQGFTEPLKLDHVPENVVILSVAPVLAFYEMGAKIAGVPKTVVIDYPEELQKVAGLVQFSAMAPDKFDAESVVKLNADLVVLSATAADTVGKTLEGLGIRCYYLYAGHTVPYESVKMQTKCIVDAYSRDEASRAKAREIMARFEKTEANCEAAKKAFAGKKVMVLQSGGESHYIQTNKGTLGSMMDLIGFTNVFENPGAPMVQLDYEQALSYEPDVVVCVGSTDAETHKATMAAAFADKADYWNAISAIQEGKWLALPSAYVSNAGLKITDNLNTLIETMAEFLDIKVELQK
ncbi:MAG: ABC transporter substrate-binding protein [Lachnospiraceae bacterium]|nr:ABC transporter substrate-binding protein [Lachnospiraceae bacterium]